MKKGLKILGVLMLALVPAYIWLFLESGTPGPPFPIELAKARALASSIPGEKPTSVHVEHITTIENIPAMGVMAGSGWSRAALPVYSYQVVFPSSTIIIDTGMKDEDHTSFDRDSYGRVQAAMGTASLIVVTHEHFDHIGGLASHPRLTALLPHALLTRTQLAHPEKMDPANFPARVLEGFRPLEYEGLHAVAPGVVLLASPGHTPGSQLVFVQLDDGRELLFIGDVAWRFANITQQRERARLATLMMGEDRGLVLSQLRALSELHEKEPKLFIVPGHDGSVIEKLIADGALIPRFEGR